MVNCRITTSRPEYIRLLREMVCLDCFTAFARTVICSFSASLAGTKQSRRKEIVYFPKKSIIPCRGKIISFDVFIKQRIGFYLFFNEKFVDKGLVFGFDKALPVIYTIIMGMTEMIVYRNGGVSLNFKTKSRGGAPPSRASIIDMI